MGREISLPTASLLWKSFAGLVYPVIRWLRGKAAAEAG